jgi:hypothetical protein
MPADREPERLNPYAAPALAESGVAPAEPLAAPAPCLQKVARGLSIYRSSSILRLILLITAYLANLAAWLLHRPAATALALSRLSWAVGLLCGAMYLLGKIFCLAAPRESKALPWIQASVLLGLLDWVIFASRFFGEASGLI